MDSIRINTDDAKGQFLSHLEIEGNDRIIFSGQFGIGKTTFLHEFKKEKKDQFRMFHLFPVNYSVANNEDVFELVKYDLFFEVLDFLIEEGKSGLLLELDVTKKEYLPFFLAENWKNISNSVLRLIPKVGKSIVDFLDEIEKLKELFEKRQKEFKQKHYKLLELFSCSIENSQGQIYEFDQFSELLKDLIQGLNSEENAKKNILVIDDLDRVDPDHLFRLLNVFAAHVDFGKEEWNKFGFHQIVFVMDIENVRSIYQNRYGERVDFSGYIDKFYSKSIFEFDILKLIEAEIVSMLHKVPLGKNNVLSFNERYNRIGQSVIHILKTFVINKGINLRSIIKNLTSKYEEIGKPIMLSSENQFELGNSNQLNFPLIIEFITRIIGSTVALEDSLKMLLRPGANAAKIDENRKVTYLVEDLIPILDDNFPFKQYSYEENYTWTISTYNIQITYKLVRDDYRFSAKILEVENINIGEQHQVSIKDLSHSVYFELFNNAYWKYKRSLL